MIVRVISGGQTGVDQAALRAARACGIPTGGWIPRGFLTESGPEPRLARAYGIQPHPSPSYPPRTKANVRDSNLTLWLEWGPSADSHGYQCTRKAAYLLSRPFLVAHGMSDPSTILAAIEKTAGPMITLNVAGSRESKAPGIGTWAERFLITMLSAQTPPMPNPNSCGSEKSASCM